MGEEKGPVRTKGMVLFNPMDDYHTAKERGQIQVLLYTCIRVYVQYTGMYLAILTIPAPPYLVLAPPTYLITVTLDAHREFK